jgi:TonB family protein
MGRTSLIIVLAVAWAGAREAGAQEKPPAPHVVAPVTVTPAPPPAAATLKMGADEESTELLAVWPATAYHVGDAGRVTLSCKIDVYGLAETCSVLSETPERKGFGRAALELRPTIKLAPPRGPDGAPVAKVMTIAVRFEPPKKELVGTEGSAAEITSMRDTAAMARALTPRSGNPLQMHAVTMVDNPVWRAAADFDDLARAYPARGAGSDGYAVAHCRVVRDGDRAGSLRDCETIKEDPEKKGFGPAALALAGKFRVAPDSLSRAPHGAPLWVDVPVRFPAQDRLSDHTVTAPVWAVGLDGRAVQKVFPPEAAAQGVISGRGVVRCDIDAGGALANCSAEPADPDGLGFSEAAIKLASRLRLNLWSADGAPVIGGVIHIPVRLNLAAAAGAPAQR